MTSTQSIVADVTADLDALTANLTADNIETTLIAHLTILLNKDPEVRAVALPRIYPLLTQVRRLNLTQPRIDRYAAIAQRNLITQTERLLNQLSLTDPLLAASLPKPQASAQLALNLAAIVKIVNRTWAKGELKDDILPGYRIGALADVDDSIRITAYATGSNHIYSGVLLHGARDLTLRAL